jgi:hypothetical protein
VLAHPGELRTETAEPGADRGGRIGKPCRGFERSTEERLAIVWYDPDLGVQACHLDRQLDAEQTERSRCEPRHR